MHCVPRAVNLNRGQAPPAAHHRKAFQMRFRPCIDIHQGRVKQIVGSTYRDGDATGMVTNFSSELPSSHFAEMYRRDGLTGGHVIMLGSGNEQAALQALRAYPGGLQIGGGITPDNAAAYLDSGASHVIMTSYVFSGGAVSWERLRQAVSRIGRKRLVLDVSCKKVGGAYRIVTDRWQRVSDVEISSATLEQLGAYCDEFLVHAADVEGTQQGVAADLIELLAQYSPVPTTYAGGIRSLVDIGEVGRAGAGRIDYTIGSALDIFGGNLRYRDVVALPRKHNL